MKQPLKQTYAYDILMVQTSLAMPQELSERTFSVRLFDEFIDLPEDRHYVNEFQDTSLGELFVTPCDLIKSLCSSGICMTVYERGTFKGSGTATMQAHNLKALAEKQCDVSEDMLIVLQQKERKIGSVLIKVRFWSTDPQME